MTQTPPLRRDPLRGLINELSKLPGIGEKSASRLAFFILASEGDYADRLAQRIGELKRKVAMCKECFNYTEDNPCAICSDEQRDRSLICVVEYPPNLLAIERTGEYHGVYHVLHGALSPLNGMGPEEIRAKELLQRLGKNQAFKEVILATNPNTEGEATSLYLSKLILPIGVPVSRLASGIPVGSDIDYTDQVTLSRAINMRQRM